MFSRSASILRLGSGTGKTVDSNIIESLGTGSKLDACEATVARTLKFAFLQWKMVGPAQVGSKPRVHVLAEGNDLQIGDQSVVNIVVCKLHDSVESQVKIVRSL